MYQSFRVYTGQGVSKHVQVRFEDGPLQLQRVSGYSNANPSLPVAAIVAESLVVSAADDAAPARTHVCAPKKHVFSRVLEHLVLFLGAMLLRFPQTLRSLPVYVPLMIWNQTGVPGIGGALMRSQRRYSLLKTGKSLHLPVVGRRRFSTTTGEGVGPIGVGVEATII